MSDARSTVRAETVVQRLGEVRQRIARACAAAGREPRSVSVLAVTKGFGPEAIEAALAAGLTDIGENYVQEAQAKFAAAAWPSYPVRRHFIGRMQRNKARRVAQLFDVVQTVTDETSARKLDEGAGEAGKVLDVLLQLNVAGDDRAGIDPSNAAAFARTLESCAALRLRGVMAVGPLDASRIAPAFALAAGALTALQREDPRVDTLSLGMSGDLEMAIAAGSTMVRLGTALFGSRPAKVSR